MRVLLDENLPHDLAGALVGHAVSTVQSLGWAGTRNCALLKRAGTVCDVFISMDGNIEHQQNLAGLSFAGPSFLTCSTPSRSQLSWRPRFSRVGTSSMAGCGLSTD